MCKIQAPTKEMLNKLVKLKEYIRKLGSVAVAFSGGVDSTFLLKVAHDTLGDRAVAITAHSSFFPAREFRETQSFCKGEQIFQISFEISESEIEGFQENPPNRCYLCKKEIFQKIIALAKKRHMLWVVEGTNLDDMEDYRPGMQAVVELGVISPLRECGLRKEEIRILSRHLGLSTWEKPSFACLASRFLYGESITKKKLSMVEQAEEFLRELGFIQLRVRIHGEMARIEVPPQDFPRLLEEENRRKIVSQLREYGFSYVAMDMQGYRMGSMNETLSFQK